MLSGTSSKQLDIAVAHDVSPYISVYPWLGGFGPKYSDPSTLPTGVGRSVDFSSDGAYIAIAHDASPYVSVYPWNRGFGTKFSDPGTVPAGFGRGAKFSPSGDAIAVVHDNTPFVAAYAWSSSGFGTKFSNPGTIPTSSGTGKREVSFSPSGNDIALTGGTQTPRIYAYPWSSSGFGTKYANPGSVPPTNARGTEFSPDGSYLAVSHSDQGYIRVYPWSSGFGTAIVSPITGIAQGLGCTFSPNSDVVVWTTNDTPFVYAYSWTGAFGTAYSNPSSAPIDTVSNARFSSDGKLIALSYSSSPYVLVYDWTNASGFGSKYADPATLPTGIGRFVTFSPEY
jgi:WD40 repeat protein